MIIDTHITLNFGTKGAVTVEEVFAAVKSLPLDGICILGWNMIPPIKDIREKAKEFGKPLFFGIEIATGKGSLLCYPRDVDSSDEIAFIDLLLSSGDYEPSKVIDCFHELGGAVVASFPYGKDGGFGDQIFYITGLDGIEIITPVEQRRYLNRALEVICSKRSHGLGGSGKIKDVSEIGTAATLFLNEVFTQEEFVAEIVKGHVWAEEFLTKLELCPADDERPPKMPRLQRGTPERRGGEGSRDKRFGGGRRFKPYRRVQ